ALKKFPPDIQEAIKTPEPQRTPGQKLLVAQVLIGADDVNPDDVKVDVHASAKAKARAKADQVFGVTEYGKSGLKLSDTDEAKRNALQEKIEELEDKLPLPLPVADGVRDGDYRLSPDGLGDSHIPGTGRPTYDVKCCFIPSPGQKFEIPPLYFGATGEDIKADAKGTPVEPGFLTVLSKGTPVLTPLPPNRPDYSSSGR